MIHLRSEIQHAEQGRLWACQPESEHVKDHGRVYDNVTK